MRSLIIGFVLGAAFLQMQAGLPSPYILLLELVAATGIYLAASRLRATLPAAALTLAAGILAGFAWAGLYAQHYLADELPVEWEGRDVTVIGTVDGLPYDFEQGTRFNFAVEQVVEPEGAATLIPSRIALSWYAGFRGEGRGTPVQVRPGERWQLVVRLRRPHGNANPHGFDYEVWLLEQGIRATGYVRPDKRGTTKNVRLDDFVPGFGNAVERVRGWLRDRILAALPEKEYAGVIVALVIGDQRAIAQSDWQVFNRTGIGHLISISGLHITMIAGMVAAAVLALWRRSFFTSAQLPLVLPAQKAAALAGALAALVYVLLAGFGVPAQRTLYMLSVVALALWMGRVTNVSHVLCLALGVVVLLDPWAVLWPGFWLSFGAVAIILFASTGRVREYAGEEQDGERRWMMLLKSGAYTQYVVTIGLVPLTMLLFGQISLVSPFANALAIPLISFVVTPLALMGSVMPAPLIGWMLGAAHVCVEWLACLLEWLSALSLAVWSAPLPSWWAFAAAVTGCLWLLAPAGWSARWLGVAGLLPLLLTAVQHPAEGEMWVTAFDVGQGTALLIETPHRRVLYDTGPAYSPESDGGNRVILPYLKARGIRKLDAMIVSHSDTDHAGGALSILDGMEIDWVLSSLPSGHPVVARAPQHQRCEAGQGWSWDGIRFDMIHPAPVSYDSTKWKPNARSCTLKISIGAQSILLPGDIEAVQEAELVESSQEQLQATVLLAPHHGSGTSSTMPFLEAVRPELALFQVGYRNRYRHPKAEVYERYRAQGIRRLRTDESGAVTLRFNGRLEASEYRREHARYWHGR